MLLFDENLAARLATGLADLYPGATHVGSRNLAGASDRAIWQHARDHNLVIVSKDEDFQQLSVLYGAAPKAIWIRLGNCSTADVERLMRERTAKSLASSRTWRQPLLLSLKARHDIKQRPGLCQPW